MTFNFTLVLCLTSFVSEFAAFVKMIKKYWLTLFLAVFLTAFQAGSDEIRLPDQERSSGGRDGKSLLDWIGLGNGPDQDPYVARTNTACLSGDLAECFKSQALTSFTEFFSKEYYP